MVAKLKQKELYNVGIEYVKNVRTKRNNALKVFMKDNKQNIAE